MFAHEVPVPLAFEDIPDNLRQSFPLVMFNGSYSCKNFIAQYPKYRHEQKPKVGKRPIRQNTASISEEQRYKVMPTGLMKFGRVSITALKSSILGDLFRHGTNCTPVVPNTNLSSTVR